MGINKNSKENGDLYSAIKGLGIYVATLAIDCVLLRLILLGGDGVNRLILSAFHDPLKPMETVVEGILRISTFFVYFFVLVPILLFLFVDLRIIFYRFIGYAPEDNLKRNEKKVKKMYDIAEIAYNLRGKLPFEYSLGTAGRIYVARVCNILYYPLLIFMGFLPFIMFSLAPTITAISIITIGTTQDSGSGLLRLTERLRGTCHQCFRMSRRLSSKGVRRALKKLNDF